MAAPMAVAADAPAVGRLAVEPRRPRGRGRGRRESAERSRTSASTTPRLDGQRVASRAATEPLRCSWGTSCADGSGVYAKLPDSRGSSPSPPTSRAALDKKPFDLRDRDLLHVKRDAVKTLEVTGPEGSYALARDDKGEWAFTKPARHQGRALGGGRPARHPREPAHGVGGGRGREGPEAVRPRQARPHRHPRPRRRQHAHPRDRGSRRRTRSTTCGTPGAAAGGGDPAARSSTTWPRAWRSCGPSACSRWRPTTWRASTSSAGGAKQTYAQDHRQGQGRRRDRRSGSGRPRREGPRDEQGRRTRSSRSGGRGAGVRRRAEGPEAYGLDAPALTVIRCGRRARPPSVARAREEGRRRSTRAGARRRVLKLDAAKADELIKAVQRSSSS